VRVQALDLRQHFLAHELGRGLPEHFLFVGKILAREHVGRTDGIGQKAATNGFSLCTHMTLAI